MTHWKFLIPLTVALAPMAVFAAEPQILVEAKVITLGERSYGELKIQEQWQADGTLLLDPDTRTKLLAQFQEKKDVTVVASPRLVTGSGVEATCRVGQAVERVDVGYTFQITPVVPADRKFIMLRYDIRETHAATGKAFETNAVAATMAIPVGNSLLVRLGQRTCEKVVCHKLPFLGDLEIVGPLFRNRATVTETEHSFVLLTALTLQNAAPPLMPTAAIPPMVMARAPMQPMLVLLQVPANRDLPCAMPVAPGMPQLLAQVQAKTALRPPVVVPPLCATTAVRNPEILKILTEQYDLACKSGDAAKARTIAAFCLEMDPLCFSRP